MKKILLSCIVSLLVPSIMIPEPPRHASKTGSRVQRTTVPTQSKLAPKASLREIIGQKIIVGFDGTSEHDPAVKQIMNLAKDGLIGGVILYGRNIESKKQLTALVSSLKKSSKYPLLVSLDQEGGKVQRLRAKNGFTEYLSAFEVAKSMTPEQALSYYSALAKELQEVGFNCNYGPVVDLHADETTKKSNPVIGGLNRAFSSDIQAIVAYATSFITAHRERKIIPCLKHYPGHGLAPSDSHKGPVDITNTHRPDERLPYKLLIKNDFDGMVMVGHLAYHTLDKIYPTSLSKVIIQDWLRKEDTFKGVVITDDLLMGAIQSKFGFEEVVLKAVEAGVDLLLFSNISTLGGKGKKFSPESLINLISSDLKSGTLKQNQLDDSFLRIMNLKEKIS